MDKITSALQSALAQLDHKKGQPPTVPGARRANTGDTDESRAPVREASRLETMLRKDEPPDRNVRRGTYLDILV